MKHGNSMILSAYLGRWITALVMVFVAGVTVSALVSGGGIGRRGTVRVCVLGHTPPDAAPQVNEMLRPALSRGLRRAVTITAVSGAVEPGFDAYVLPAFDWLRCADELGIVPVCGVEAEGSPSSAVLLLTTAGRDSIDYAALSSGDIAFDNLRSVGGFWAQAAMLSAAGFRMPARLSEFRFAGSNTNGSEGALLAVLSGRCVLGVCSETVLNALVERGFVDARALRVVARTPPIPETIIAAAKKNETQLEERMLEPAAAFECPDNSTPSKQAGLTIEKLSPDTRRALEETIELARRYRGQF